MIDAAVYGALVAVFALTAWVVGRRRGRREVADDGCACWIFEPGDDFDVWESQLDGDDSAPALVDPTPVSDEYLLDVWNTTRDPEVAR